jgi:prepilin-type N-terminal cleavage/methylation domain-containing protein
MPKLKCYSGFSLMEMMVVVILIGIIAGFAVPIYTKSLGKAEEKKAAINLAAISEAMNRHMIANDLTAFPDLNTITDINSTLGTYIIADQGAYECGLSIGAETNVCVYDSEDGSWGLHIHDSARDIHCTKGAGVCPTCNPDCDHYFQ